MTGRTETAPGARADRGETAEIEPFAAVMERHGLSLVRGATNVLQINTGLLCNLRCRHCHLEAGPGRTEFMSRDTMEEVVGFARRVPFQAIDVTGGSPEMVPGLPFLIESLASLAPRLMLRSNLAALEGAEGNELIDLCVARRVVLTASFPSTDPSQTDAQRGAGAARRGIAMLRELNARGYGIEGTGLELNLVSNPGGAFLPVSQAPAEKKFRRDLSRKWGISFNGLFTFANVPLGRFRTWLFESGNYGRYLKTLADGFNPCTVEGLMCRTQLSVSWDGALYDCDFNLAAGRYLGGRRMRVSEAGGMPAPGSAIAVGDYCYACTAGSGFT
jgi:radical SAM/Cys-rich protein